MFVAQQKRKENIAEYILYLWQLEDLLRALQFSPEAIWSHLVEPSGRSELEKQQLLIWYTELGNLLKSEGKTEGGHLDHTLHLIGDLQGFHYRLMEIPEGAQYKAAFETLKEELPRLRIVLAKDGVSDMELCFRALYGVMLYRMKGDTERSEALADVVGTISPVIALLADAYRKAERGEISLYQE
ncbi:MAG: DUF4924 family protein [Tidjanibacter sp.]|nr:DUF4924 family protein [Tidjanibacter sp.]